MSTSVEGSTIVFGAPIWIPNARVYVIATPEGCKNSLCPKEIASTISDNDGRFMLDFKGSEGVNYTLHMEAAGYLDVTYDQDRRIDPGEKNLMSVYGGAKGYVRFNIKQTSTVDSLWMLTLRAGYGSFAMSPVTDTVYIGTLWVRGFPGIILKKYYQHVLITENPPAKAVVGDTVDCWIEY